MRTEVFKTYKDKMGEAVEDCTKTLETIDSVASITDMKY
jgi:hypothetical protein